MAAGKSDASLACKVTVAALGNFLEWYDFAVFGIFAAEIGGAFFAQEEQEAGSGEAQQQQAIIQSFTVYAGAFVVRPLGGVLFGAIGDRYGREKALLATILLMALPTLAISVLPTYEQWGVAAAVLLSVLRMLQGIAAGGELPGALCYAVESAPPHQKGLLGALVQASGVGSLLASFVAAVLHAALGAEAVAAWGWRIPFALGGLIALLTCVVRRNFGASPEWAAAQRDGGAPKHPLLWLVSARGRAVRRQVLRLACVNAAQMVGFYSFFVSQTVDSARVAVAPLATPGSLLAAAIGSGRPSKRQRRPRASRRASIGSGAVCEIGPVSPLATLGRLIDAWLGAAAAATTATTTVTPAGLRASPCVRMRPHASPSR